MVFNEIYCLLIKSSELVGSGVGKEKLEAQDRLE